MMSRATAKPKLTLLEELKTKGIDSVVATMKKDMEVELKKKEAQIRRKEVMIEKHQAELVAMFKEAANMKVRILKVRYLSKSLKSSL